MKTYNQQFDRLTQAYIAGEVNPMEPCACFVGNILNNTSRWVNARDFHHVGPYPVIRVDTRVHDENVYKGIQSIMKESEGAYTPQEIVTLEQLFLQTIVLYGGNIHAWGENGTPTQMDEDALFEAFSATLEKLKQIHIDRGEIIDNEPVFVKRELQLT